MEFYFHFFLNSFVYNIWPLELLWLLPLPRSLECLPFVSLVEKNSAIKLRTGCYLGKSLSRSEGSHGRNSLLEHICTVYPNIIKAVPDRLHFCVLFSGLHFLDAFISLNYFKSNTLVILF